MGADTDFAIEQKIVRTIVCIFATWCINLRKSTDMTNKLISSASYADSKPHYHILDGLRGAAALMVVWYHVFEGFAFAEGSAIDVFNHGYLAVDFFFML